MYTNSELITKVRFDFALLLCEVVRHGLPCRPFENWRYVDTMAVLQTTSRHRCAKLQCLSHRIMAETGRAHRAPLGEAAACLLQCRGTFQSHLAKWIPRLLTIA